MLKRTAGVDMTFVPYPGNAPAVSALLGDHVTSVLAVYPTVAEQIKSERLRAIVGGVARLVGIEGGVVSEVINPESSGVEAPDRRPRHDEPYYERRFRTAR
jgi:hypothetical protein